MLKNDLHALCTDCLDMTNDLVWVDDDPLCYDCWEKRNNEEES